MLLPLVFFVSVGVSNGLVCRDEWGSTSECGRNSSCYTITERHTVSRCTIYKMETTCINNNSSTVDCYCNVDRCNYIPNVSVGESLRRVPSTSSSSLLCYVHTPMSPLLLKQRVMQCFGSCQLIINQAYRIGCHLGGKQESGCHEKRETYGRVTKTCFCNDDNCNTPPPPPSSPPPPTIIFNTTTAASTTTVAAATSNPVISLNWILYPVILGMCFVLVSILSLVIYQHPSKNFWCCGQKKYGTMKNKELV